MARPKHLGYELLEMADFFLHLHQSFVPDREESKCSTSLTHEEQKWSTLPIHEQLVFPHPSDIARPE